jgi:hypothetical protein
MTNSPGDQMSQHPAPCTPGDPGSHIAESSLRKPIAPAWRCVTGVLLDPATRRHKQQGQLDNSSECQNQTEQQRQSALESMRARQTPASPELTQSKGIMDKVCHRFPGWHRVPSPLDQLRSLSATAKSSIDHSIDRILQFAINIQNRSRRDRRSRAWRF